MNPASPDPLAAHPVRQPATVADACAVVREAQAIYPIGGRTQQQIGRTPTQPGIALDLTALTRVIDYPARDMTITVEAGLKLADLARLLASENQRLPIDVPHAELATVGGILATNTSGPRRLGYGTLRDYLIGISVIDDNGTLTKAGGRVVKNVAGYDLCKLHIGALGTLGVIAQVTFKLRPRTAAQALITCGCPGDKLEGLLTHLHSGRARPVAVEVLNRRAADALGHSLPAGEWVVAVGLEESEAAVSSQTAQVIADLATGGGEAVQVVAGVTSEPLWSALVEATDASATVALKANLLPSAVATFCRTLGRRGEGWAIQAHAGSGIVRASVGASVTPEQVAAALAELHPLARQAAGNIVLPRCPAAWKARLPIWGEARGDVVVMRRIKQALDPRGLFNPGRFLEGIES